METQMDILIWIGACISLAGVAALVWCVIRVISAKRQKVSEDEMRALLQKVVPLNSAALFLSVIGLMVVVVGIILS